MRMPPGISIAGASSPAPCSSQIQASTITAVSAASATARSRRSRARSISGTPNSAALLGPGDRVGRPLAPMPKRRCGPQKATKHSVGRLGYGVQCLLRRLDGSLRCGEIAKRDDADEQLIAVHHRQTPHLDVRHILRGRLETPARGS